MLISENEILSSKYNLSEIENYINVSLAFSVFLTIFTIILLTSLFIIGERCYDSESQKIRYCISWAVSKISPEHKKNIVISKLTFLFLDFLLLLVFSIAFSYIRNNNGIISWVFIYFLNTLVVKIVTIVFIFASSSYSISITVWTIFHVLLKKGIKLKAEEL